MLGAEKTQFMSLMVCKLDPGLHSKGWAGSHFIHAVCIFKRQFCQVIASLKTRSAYACAFLLLSAAFTMPGLLPNTLKLISYITFKAEVSIVDKARGIKLYRGLYLDLFIYTLRLISNRAVDNLPL